MLLVSTYVAPSSIEGVGLFAAEDIPAGTAIWRFDRSFDLLLSPDDVARLDDVQAAYVERYGYSYEADRSYIVIESDNGRFMNHSETPNTDFSQSGTGTALIDIPAGAEILCDYGEFEPGFTILPGKMFLNSAQLEVA